MSTEQKPCVVCGMIEGVMGTHGVDDKPESRYPVCRNCHENGDHEKWWHKAVAELNASKWAWPSLGNLAADYKELQRIQRREARNEDGICPNGCARLTYPEPGVEKCPACGFTGFKVGVSAV